MSPLRGLSGFQTSHDSELENYRTLEHETSRNTSKTDCCLLSLPSFAQVSSVFAQVSGVGGGGELTTRLRRAAHSVYCPDPISEGSVGGGLQDGWMGRWTEFGGLNEELTEVPLGVVLRVVHVGGGQGGVMEGNQTAVTHG